MLFIIPISLTGFIVLQLICCMFESAVDASNERYRARAIREEARRRDPVYQAKLRRQAERARISAIYHAERAAKADAWYAKNWWWTRLPVAILVYGTIAAIPLTVVYYALVD